MAIVDERLARRGNVGKTSEILVTERTFGLAILVYNDFIRCESSRSLMLTANVVV